MKPTVSVITVSYNAAQTIEKTIQSVVQQTYANIEYIVIDGGSTDGTVDIIRKYAEHLTYWVSEPDKGIYDAMNKGIKKASGDIIGILNADDWYDDNTVNVVAEKFHQNPDLDLIHGDIIYTTQEGTPYARFAPTFHGEDIWHDMIFYHPTCFLKRQVYSQYGMFSTEYSLAGDFDLMLRFFLKKIKYEYISDDLVYFRLGGASHQSAELGMRQQMDISIKYGYNKIFAYGWFYYKIIKFRLYNFLSKSAFRFIISFYHRCVRHRTNIEEVK